MNTKRLVFGLLGSSWFVCLMLALWLITTGPERSALILGPTQCEVLTQLNSTLTHYPGFCHYQGNVKFIGRETQLDQHIEIPRSNLLAYQPMSTPHPLVRLFLKSYSRGAQP